VRLAWCVGSGTAVLGEEGEEALDAYLELFHGFVAAHRRSCGMREVRRIAATVLLRLAGRATGGLPWRLRRSALAIDPGIPVTAPIVRVENHLAGRRHRRPARAVLMGLRGHRP